MKRKVFSVIFILMLIISCSTGCFKRDKMEDIDIVTTIYPIEYVTNKLYGSNSVITGIYPNGSIPDEYKITNKNLRDYSQKDLFIYNGESKEREYATSMLSLNKNLKIIDASYGIDSVYKDSDVWLNPSNILMIAQNIRNELSEYITNSYIIDDINSKYDLLKVDITELETEMKKAADNSNSINIVVMDESLNFLEKYGFNVINLSEKGKIKQSNVDLATSLYKNKKISYIFIIENESINKDVESFINNYDIDKLTIRSLENITDDDVENNDDYLSLMHHNLDLLKKEAYD